ncbi:MAG TPA: hypothetical protein VGN14_11410 [Candidatus Elarobacter sp.]
MIVAGARAAGDVYEVHYAGLDNGMSRSDINNFDLQYVNVQKRANGLLGGLSFQLEVNKLDIPVLTADANAVMEQAKLLDGFVDDIRRRQAQAGRGGGLLSTLTSIVPLLNPVLSAVSTIIGFSQARVKRDAEYRQTLIAQIKKHYWVDVKTAAATNVPNEAPEPRASQAP